MSETQVMRHHGSCLCGAVRFEIEGGFDRFYLCHCAHCRKDTGSAHAANLFSATATLHWLAGEDKATLYRLPDTRHARSFCAVCGSALPYASERMIVVPAGSLDGAFDAAPDAHLFVASRAAWEHDLDRIPAFDAFPS
ncbi:GFA family protein [Thermomonas brevis]|nr:GFA family protein [Thermomonas brevis]